MKQKNLGALLLISPRMMGFPSGRIPQDTVPTDSIVPAGTEDLPGISLVLASPIVGKKGLRSRGGIRGLAGRGKPGWGDHGRVTRPKTFAARLSDSGEALKSAFAGEG